MEATNLPREKSLGLVIAILAHAGLLALLVLKPPSPALVPPPERMSVTLSDNVGLTSTAPEPAAEPAPDRAPEVSPMPQPEAEAEPLPPRPQPTVQPGITQPRPRAPIASPAPQPKPTAKPVPKPRTASTIGSDFLKGVTGAKSDSEAKTPPAAAIGPAVQSSLIAAISRQIKPRWVAPQGADAEKLVTFVTWKLNPDGTLSGTPTTRQEGITDANRAQAPRHAEQAIRAIKLAEPFDLPPPFYNTWKRVVDFRFDRKLSQ